eukprot:4207228-Alexandrium_andersonii.AAC.1
MADAVSLVAESSPLREVLVAGQGAPFASAAAGQGMAGSAAPPIGRWSAPISPAGSGALQPGMPGTW